MKCNYCNKEIPLGTGILFVKKDGTAYNLCSSKCEKNLFKLNRKASKVKWVTKSKANKELKLAKDKTKKAKA